MLMNYSCQLWRAAQTRAAKCNLKFPETRAVAKKTQSPTFLLRSKNRSRHCDSYAFCETRLSATKSHHQSSSSSPQYHSPQTIPSRTIPHSLLTDTSHDLNDLRRVPPIPTYTRPISRWLERVIMTSWYVLTATLTRGER